MLRPVMMFSLAAAVAAPLSGQSGVVRYDQATRIDFTPPPGVQIPAGRIPRSSVRPMLLTFTPGMASWAAAPRDQAADAARMAEMRDVIVVREAGGQMIVRGGGPPGDMVALGPAMAFGGGRGDMLTGAFTNFEDGNIVEVRELLGRSFRISEELPNYAWRLTGEQATFLGYPVFQAVAQKDSTTLEAWFTPEIPVPAGPAQYGGLPGLILTLTVDNDRITYTATSIDTTAAVDQIKMPTDGSKVTRAEYDKIVEEKMAEMARMRRGRNN
jgi:hypothetical protein